MPRSTKRSSSTTSRRSDSNTSKTKGEKTPSKKRDSPSSSKGSSKVPTSSEATMPYEGNFVVPKRFVAKKPSDDSQAKKELFPEANRYEPLAEILHCKAVVFAHLPYDTLLCALTPLTHASESKLQADWVSAKALLKAIRSNGVVYEDGKEDKNLLEVPELSRMYAQDLLMDLVLESSHDTLQPMVLMRRTYSNTHDGSGVIPRDYIPR